MDDRQIALISSISMRKFVVIRKHVFFCVKVEKYKLNSRVRLTMVAVISVRRSLGSDGNRVTFGLTRTASSRTVMGGEPVAVKSCRSFWEDMKLELEKGLDA